MNSKLTNPYLFILNKPRQSWIPIDFWKKSYLKIVNPGQFEISRQKFCYICWHFMYCVSVLSSAAELGSTKRPKVGFGLLSFLNVSEQNKWKWNLSKYFFFLQARTLHLCIFLRLKRPLELNIRVLNCYKSDWNRKVIDPFLCSNSDFNVRITKKISYQYFHNF